MTVWIESLTGPTDPPTPAPAASDHRTEPAAESATGRFAAADHAVESAGRRFTAVSGPVASGPVAAESALEFAAGRFSTVDQTVADRAAEHSVDPAVVRVVDCAAERSAKPDIARAVVVEPAAVSVAGRDAYRRRVVATEPMPWAGGGAGADRWDAESFWAGSRKPLTEATGLPPESYSDEGFFAAERSRVFERSWVAVGCAAEVAEAGRLLVRRVGGRSILITRDRQGVLRGFVNACRHRGTELAESDCEVGNIIRCPYHRWGYRLDGSLRSTPRFEEIPRAGFDRDDFGLVEVRVDTWGLILFVCLDTETPPLRVWLGDLPRRMCGYGFENWRLQSEATFEVRANWKLITENFQEYYHLSWVHPELAKVSRAEDHYRYQGPGMYCGQTTTPVSGDDRDDWLVLPPAAGLNRSDLVSGRFVAVFPNVLLSVLPNHVLVIRLEPLAPGLTREHCTFLLPASTSQTSDRDMARTRSFWFDINNEDINVVERAQRGVTTGAVTAGPLAPRFEEPLHRFHNMLADLMTAPSGADVAVPGGDEDSEAARLGSGINPHPIEGHV